MSHRTFIAVALAAASLFILPPFTRLALAADLDGGYASPQPMAEQKVEFGTGWYIRGDIGVTQSYDVQATSNGDTYNTRIFKTNNPGYGLSLGGGYALTNGFRGDITADFNQPAKSEFANTLCFDGVTQDCTIIGKFKSYDALANVYYEFGAWGIVSPYVGAGVGVGFGELSTALYGGATTYGGATGYHNLAWALMAGVAIDVYDHVKLDIGYRYRDNGMVTALGYIPSGTAAQSHLYYNEIRAGLRYMIDN